jgi:hypothetical protein
MIGHYVRMTTAPARMGIVVAARFDQGQVSFLFRQDPRLTDTWLPADDLEECAKPVYEQVATINKPAKEQYVAMAIAPNTRAGTINAARFDKGHVSYLFHPNPQSDDTSSDIWLLDSDLERDGRPAGEQVVGTSDP